MIREASFGSVVLSKRGIVRALVRLSSDCLDELVYGGYMDWATTVTAVGTVLGGLALPLAFIQLGISMILRTMR